MATTGKAQGGSSFESSLGEKSPNDANRDQSKDVGKSEEGKFSAPMGEVAGPTQGAGGLSSIPGGKNRSGAAGKEAATEGWTGQLKEGASTFVNRAQEVVSDVAGRAQKTASKASENVGSSIRRYPIQALMIGFGVGCLVGMLVPFRR